MLLQLHIFSEKLVTRQDSLVTIVRLDVGSPEKINDPGPRVMLIKLRVKIGHRVDHSVHDPKAFTIISGPTPASRVTSKSLFHQHSLRSHDHLLSRIVRFY